LAYAEGIGTYETHDRGRRENAYVVATYGADEDVGDGEGDDPHQAELPLIAQEDEGRAAGGEAARERAERPAREGGAIGTQGDARREEPVHQEREVLEMTPARDVVLPQDDLRSRGRREGGFAKAVHAKEPKPKARGMPTSCLRPSRDPRRSRAAVRPQGA